MSEEPVLQPKIKGRYSVNENMSLSSTQNLHGSIITDSLYADGEPRWAAVCNAGVLRVFMSSTFRDMQRERDEFFANAERKLKDFAKKRGLILVFIDLRWGLTSEISENGLVVISCLESINECPYFLCTLGSRYGWSPNYENPSEWHPETDVKFPYLKDIRGLSVTDYEIVHGALNENAVARRALFYSRDEEYAVNHIAENEAERSLYRPVNEKDRENQDRLKRKIGNIFCIKQYKTPKELVSMILEDLIDAIKEDFPENEHKSPEDMAHEQFMRHRLIGLEGRDEIIARLKENAMQQLDIDGSNITLVGAESGIGKSAVMSGLVRDLVADKKPDLVVIYHFVGCSNLSNYVENLVERVTRILVENGVVNLNMDSEEGKEYVKKGLDFIFNLAARNEKKKAVVVIDALDQLVESQQYKNVHHLEWLPKKTPKNISVIVSSIATDESCKAHDSNRFDVISVDKLDNDGIRMAATSFFKRYNKSLNKKQMEMIIRDNMDTGHPLYLRIVLDELRVFGIYERVDTELNAMLKTHGVVDLFDLVMIRWEKKYGKNLVRISISVLYASRIGLDENELDKYMEHRLNQINEPNKRATWKAFLFVLLDSLFVRNGRYSFSHQLLVQSIQQRYFEKRENVIVEALNYGLWLLDEYGHDTEDMSVVAEICYQMRVARKYEKLANYLKDEKVIQGLLDGNYRFEFFGFWRDLNSNGFDHRDVYREMAEELTPVGSALVDYFRQVQEYNFLIPILEHRISVETDEGSNSKNLNTLGIIYMNLEKDEKALEYYTRSLEIRIKVFGESHFSVAALYNNIGALYKRLEKYETALEYYRKDLEITVMLFGEMHPKVASSYNNIGVVHLCLGKYDEASEYHRKSLEIQLKAYGEMHPDVASSYNNMGNVCNRQGNNKLALEYYEKSALIREKIYGEIHSDVADSYNNIGVIKKALKMNEEAHKIHQKALEIRLKIYGDIHTSVAASYRNIGGTLINMGRYKEALEVYEKDLGINCSLFGEMRSSVADSYDNVAFVHRSIGNNEKALENYFKSLEIRLKVLGETHQSLADTYSNIGFLQKTLGKYEAALKYYEKETEINMKTFGEVHPSVADSHNNIGVVYKTLGNNKKAMEHYKKSHDIRTKVYGEMHKSVGDSYYNIGNLYDQEKSHRDALETFQKVKNIYEHVYGAKHPETVAVERRISRSQYFLNPREGTNGHRLGKDEKKDCAVQ